MAVHIPRTFSFIDDEGRSARVVEDDLAFTTGPTVVLGEPGMGKTDALRRIAATTGWPFRSAVSFVNHPSSAALVANAAGMVIDGLDELAAAQVSEPINRVLGRLIEAGCPPFVLSCRAADWRSAVALQDIADAYGMQARELSLDPLTRDGAVAFLEARLGIERAAELVGHLERGAVVDLYGNPLTLALLGEVAAEGGSLPRSRAELLLRATDVMWSELGDGHEGSALSELDRETALAAAGVLSAAFVLTGADAITLAPSSARRAHAVHAPTLRALPGGDHARTLVGSRLFTSVPDAEDGFKPIHRAVAEFLGARWLARSVTDEQARMRALAMFTIDGGVPASLRGMHAWLAQDARFADDVIAADPYGVLRYGDADGLGVDGGRKLLAALVELAGNDPFFRAEDWASHSARGLTHLELEEDVRAILVDDGTGMHLRTLVLGAIRGSSLAAALADDLRRVVLGEGGRPRSYQERSEAAAVVASDGCVVDVADLVERLARSADQDGRRLALDVMRMVRFTGFAAEDVARALLAHVGPLDGSDAEEAGLDDEGSLFAVDHAIPDDLVAPLLDALTAMVHVEDIDGVPSRREQLSDFAVALTVRQLALGPIDPSRLLGWLRLGSIHLTIADSDRRAVTDHLRRNPDLRRAIQRDVMLAECERGGVANLTWRLGEISNGLRPDTDDVVHLLAVLAGMAGMAVPADGASEVWFDLAAQVRRDESRACEVLEAARPFAEGDARLEGHLGTLGEPHVPAAWEVDRAARHERRERDKALARASARSQFSNHEAALRAGELRWTLPAAWAYLGRFSDLAGGATPAGRITEWLGPELQTAALAGFEATLRRPDLPTPRQVADGYAETRRWNVVDPLTAAIIQRMRDGRDLKDVPLDAVMLVGLALRHEPRDEGRLPSGAAAWLEGFLRRDAAAYERYVRLLIEPSLERRLTLVPTLHGFGEPAADQALARRLAGEWLERHTDLPSDVELGLVDVLARDEDGAALRAVHALRAAEGLHDHQRRRNWQAVGLLADFDATAATLGEARTFDRHLIWSVRHRLAPPRGRKGPLTILGARALSWLISRFRLGWPYRDLPVGGWSGDTNDWDATAFICVLVNRLAGDLGDDAVVELARLVVEPEDGYTAAIRHGADQQRRARREERFEGVTLERLRDVVQVRPPRTTGDLDAIVRFAFERLQDQVRGSDTDVAGKYWLDGTRPQGEDFCTDRLIEDLERLLPRHGIGRTPQRDMPAGKRADIVFTLGELALPVECKGQWNRDLWTAPGDQLDAFYLRDWRSQDRGVYVVYWHGGGVESGRRLKAPPSGASPSTPEDLRRLLIQHVEPARRGNISVVVLDLTR